MLHLFLLQVECSSGSVGAIPHLLQLLTHRDSQNRLICATLTESGGGPEQRWSPLPFCKYLSSQLDEFLVTNDTSETSDSNLWETFQVVMRAPIISYEASLTP